MSHINIGQVHTTNANSIHEALTQGASSAVSLMGKLQDSLKSRARVTAREDDCSSYRISFGNEDIDYPALLSFDKSLYALIGFPKMGDIVTVTHDAGNNAYILFTSNDKNYADPPLYGTTTKFTKSIASSKCMG